MSEFYPEGTDFSLEEFDLYPGLEDVKVETVPDQRPDQGDIQDPDAGAQAMGLLASSSMPLAPRRGSAAVEWAKGQHDDGGREWQGWCLSFVRQAFECPAGVRSASDAWDNAHFKHHTTQGSHAPRAAAFFWKGGSHGFGHIVITVGGGLCWSNDIRVAGGISLVHIDEITARWGEEPMGWTEDLNGRRIWVKPHVPVVDLSNVRRQFFHALEGKPVQKTHGVGRIQSALNARYKAGLKVDGLAGEKTLNAYGYHEYKVGISGRPRIPDEMTLKNLGKGRFRVRK